jgi:hypothetical protein
MPASEDRSLSLSNKKVFLAGAGGFIDAARDPFVSEFAPYSLRGD